MVGPQPGRRLGFAGKGIEERIINADHRKII
jgi:hypothetical protein